MIKELQDRSFRKLYGNCAKKKNVQVYNTYSLMYKNTNVCVLM